ncbi:TSSC1 [Olea europaea subsp. europaea]|uniref:TSSC1 n=1 Tax=Olea europaea subsp. europaea TaxID=158383 RepID=A0A8S0Q4C2_OLEEU|nr:TSSC1 [Olea europaea subsp. europaea]
MSIVTTFESQCRALTSTSSPDEDSSRFLVGTLSPTGNNLLYLLEYKDDNNNLAKVSFKFPFGEVWHLSTSSKYPNLVAGVLGNTGELSVALFKLPDELANSIEDDYGLSESPIEQVFEVYTGDKNLVRLSQWHPEDGSQLLTCANGHMDIWDIERQTKAKSFSLLGSAEKFLDLESGELKPSQVTDLRWSSLFDCSVIAAAVGSKVLGIDTRIPDSSPASVCWLIQDQRCNKVRSIDFNPNSQYYIASGGDDCRANFWDLRKTSTPALNLQTHTHWIWSIRYNPFHDQLVLSAGSDSRVALMRAQSVASDPYGQAVDDDEDENSSQGDDEEKENNQQQDESDTANGDKLENVVGESKTKDKNDQKPLTNEVIHVYQEHDDSVYAAEWATDPWIFASLGLESRLVIGRVPKKEKFNILF